MARVTIDEVEYDTESLSEEARAQVLSIQFIDVEMSRLQSTMAVMGTARNAYATALKALLPASPERDDTELS